MTIQTINILICDDDIEFTSKLEYLIKERFTDYFDVNIHKYYNPNDVLNDSEKFQVAFLDIEMPRLDGFTLASLLMKKNKKMRIIFVTSKSELVYSSFDYNAYDFVRKDELGDFSKKVNRWVRDLRSKTYQMVYQGNRIEINIDDIIKATKSSNNLFLVTIHGVYKERKKISIILIELNNIEKRFIQPHRSEIINVNHISNIIGNELILTNGEKVMIPKLNRKKVKLEILNIKSKE